MSALFLFVSFAMAALAPGRDHAEAAEAVARAVEAEPPLFASDERRLRTAALLVAVTFRESSFRNDVRSETDDYCMAQVHGRPDLAHDLDACLRVAMAMLRESVRACGRDNPLGVYATGTCSAPRGRRISRDRMWLAKRLLGSAP